MFSIFLILDIIGNYFIYTNITLIYIILYSYKKYTNTYFVLILGFIYDILISNKLFLNSLIYFITYLIIKKYKHLNKYLLGLIVIISAIFINYIFSYILNNTKLNIYIIYLILINYIIYIILSNKKITKLI